MFSLLNGASSAPSREIQSAVAMLAAARRVLVLTGAGMSADSGLPTYRGIGGLYDEAVTEDHVAIEDALSGEMLARDPALTWKYIGQIERACRGAKPNAGHDALARLQSRYERLCVLTQNVDGFHSVAGSNDVIEMHGDIHRLRCIGCDNGSWVADYSGLDALPPTCSICGGMLRPEVVLFGEMLPMRSVARYEAALAGGFDAMLVIGTSAVFPYIAAPVRDAWKQGVATIEINPQETEISRFCRATIRLPAAEALGEIEKKLLPEAEKIRHPG